MDTVVLDPKTVAWLERERGIPPEVSAKCGVVTVGGNPAFEFRLSGVLRYRKVRIDEGNGEKTFRRDRSNVETCMWGEDWLQEDPDLAAPLVICEGEIDRLSLVAANIPNVVSVPDGAQLDKPGTGRIVPLDDRAFAWLWTEEGQLKPWLSQFPRVVICVDKDEKGRILRDELAVRFERWKCDTVAYPEGCKDANEVLLRHGVAAVADLVSKAVPLVPSNLTKFGLIPRIGNGETFASGFSSLDDCLKFAFVMPELVIVSGDAGAGKSEFAAILGANLVRLHGLPGAIMQFEDRTARVHETLIRYSLSQVEGVNDRGQARAWVDDWFHTISPDEKDNADSDFNIEWLKAALREARVRHGARWVVLDPWNELDHMWDRTQSEAIYTNDALRHLKRIGRALQIILIIVVHPSKEGARNKEIVDKDLYGISGSAAWANKADHGLIIHRPDQSRQEVYVKVAKSKDHLLMGKPGIVRMRYEPQQARYIHVGFGV